MGPDYLQWTAESLGYTAGISFFIGTGQSMPESPNDIGVTLQTNPQSLFSSYSGRRFTVGDPTTVVLETLNCSATVFDAVAVPKFDFNLERAGYAVCRPALGNYLLRWEVLPLRGTAVRIDGPHPRAMIDERDTSAEVTPVQAPRHGSFSDSLSRWRDAAVRLEGTRRMTGPRASATWSEAERVRAVKRLPDTAGNEVSPKCFPAGIAG
jgi:hypothetical protein